MSSTNEEYDGTCYQIKSESDISSSDDAVTKVNCTDCGKELKVLIKDTVSEEGEPEIIFECSDCIFDMTKIFEDKSTRKVEYDFRVILGSAPEL